MQPKFKQAQLALGLKKQFYDAKFVYSQQQVSNRNAYLISLFKQLPSQLHGFLPLDIQMIHAFASQVLREAAKSLNVPISTLIVAQSLFHFFYARKSFLQYDIRDIIMGCMYLACKSEETLRRSYEIAFVFDYLFKVYEGEQSPKVLIVSSTEYEHMKNNTIMKAQLDILFELGFQIYRLLDIPHRYLGLFLTLFQKHPLYLKICQSAWRKLNDCYHTTICLYYPHNIIAAAAVYMGMRQNGAKFPEVPWWTLLEAYEQAIQNIQIYVEKLYLHSKELDFSKISLRLKEVGQNFGYMNPFPVPYYRKIWLEKKGKFRVTKQQMQSNENKRQQLKVQQSKQSIKQLTGGRKILKVKTIEQSNNMESRKQSIDRPKQKQAQKQKVNIDKKGLLANIAEKLSKHPTVLSKAAKKQSSSSSSSSDQMDEQSELIAELKRKKELNKQLAMNQKNGPDKKQL